MTSVAIDRDKVLRLTRELWNEQGQLDIDQIDGTFYVHVCLENEIAAIDEAQPAGRHSSYADSQIRRFLPNAPVGMYTYVIPNRPRLRDAVEMSSIHYGMRLNAKGELVRPESQPDSRPSLVALAWVRLGIRNREWTGKQVARAIVSHDHVGLMEFSSPPRPPYPDNEAIAIIGATLYREGEYGRQLFWDPTQEHPESPPEVWDEEGRLRILVDHSDPRWEVIPWPPMIVISVAEPVPPESVIAEYYDRVVIEQRAWNQHLMGASDGQNVSTAIRTWAAGLLIASGVKSYIAYGDVAHATGQEFPSERVYFDNKRLLIKRVPEATPFFAR